MAACSSEDDNRQSSMTTACAAHREADASGESAAEATELPMGTMHASSSWLRPCRIDKGQRGTGRDWVGTWEVTEAQGPH